MSDDIEVRYDDECCVDEIVAHGVDVHIERLDHDSWYVRVGSMTLDIAYTGWQVECMVIDDE